MIVALEPAGAGLICDQQLARAEADSVGQLATLPPAVEQRGAAARHQHRHVGDDPVGRIARRDADEIALLHAMPRDEPACRHSRRGIGFGESQPQRAVDDELLVGVGGAEMPEILRQRGRCLDQQRHVHPEARDTERRGLEQPAGCVMAFERAFEIEVELARHS